MIQLLEPQHVYMLDGRKVPGVTEVLSLFADYARVPTAVLEAKRLIGRAVHSCIELYEAGTLDPDSVDPACAPYLEGWIRLKSDKPFRVIAAEQIVYSEKYRYAGRLDMNAELDGRIWQLDIKCVDQMSPATALQTAAYAQAWNERGLSLITRRAGVQLRPDGTYRLFPYTERTDFNLFCNALNIQRWKDNHQ